MRRRMGKQWPRTKRSLSTSLFRNTKTVGKELTVLPVANSMIPAMNWHTPPKNIKTPIIAFGTVMPRE
jgi:hypothetical protein